jgi:hypothetical protein
MICESPLKIIAGGCAQTIHFLPLSRHKNVPPGLSMFFDENDEQKQEEKGQKCTGQKKAEKQANGGEDGGWKRGKGWLARVLLALQTRRGEEDWLGRLRADERGLHRLHDELGTAIQIEPLQGEAEFGASQFGLFILGG